MYLITDVFDHRCIYVSEITHALYLQYQVAAFAERNGWLVGRKVTGDPHVCAGELSFVLPLPALRLPAPPTTLGIMLEDTGTILSISFRCPMIDT